MEESHDRSSTTSRQVINLDERRAEKQDPSVTEQRAADLLAIMLTSIICMLSFAAMAFYLAFFHKGAEQIGILSISALAAIWLGIQGINTFRIHHEEIRLAPEVWQGYKHRIQVAAILITAGLLWLATDLWFLSIALLWVGFHLLIPRKAS